LTFKDWGTTALDAIESLLLLGGDSFLPLDWYVWERGSDGKPTFGVATQDSHGTEWHARFSEGAEASDAGPDSGEMINGCIVSYDDGSGVKRSVGPPDSGADSIQTSLRDLSDSNPANRTGGLHFLHFDAGITFQAGAILIGRVILAERNRQEWRGDIVLKDSVRDAAGNWHPVSMVRAGDRIVIEDDPADDVRPRRVVNTSWSADNQQVSCSIGAPPDRLDALLARLNVVLVGRLS
jgi:hypothetical protein